MSINRQSILVGFCFVIAILISGSMLIWPPLSRRHKLQFDIGSLEKKIEGLSLHTTELERLVRRVEHLRHQVRHDLKNIPDSPNPAGLMMHLTHHTEKSGARDRTFTAGGGGSAGGITGGIAGTEKAEDGENLRFAALTIDLSSEFHDIYALIQAVENMPRLVRVASVHLEHTQDKENDFPENSLVTASIDLEAVYRAGEE